MNKPHRSDNKRPGLEWRPLAVFKGPDPVVPENAPEHVKEKARRYAAVQVEIASAGFDHKLGVDRVKFSHQLGWVGPDEVFMRTSHVPDERVSEFIQALQASAANAKVAHSNAVKEAKGQLTTSLQRQMQKVAPKAAVAQPASGTSAVKAAG